MTRGDLIGSLGHTGFVTGPHLHFDISLDDVRQDPWPLLEQNQTGEEDFMPLPLRERYERWTVPAGTRFFTDGPGIGVEKQFTTEEKLQTVAESANGEWRLLRFQNSTSAPRELLYVRRASSCRRSPGASRHTTRALLRPSGRPDDAALVTNITREFFQAPRCSGAPMPSRARRRT